MSKKKAKSYLSWPFLIKIAGLALIYAVLAKLGLALSFTTEQVTTVWPPTGMALAAILILGFRFWPGILLGAFVANILTNETIPVASGIAIGNTLEALAGAYLLLRIIKFDSNFYRLKDFFGLLLLSGVISTLISATIGTISLSLGGLVAPNEHAFTWLVWWVGDMMGALIFAPLILIFIKNKFSSLRQKPLEALALVVLTLAVCILVFGQSPSSAVAFPYLVFPIIIWAALRFRQAGAVVTTALIAGTAIWGTIERTGLFTNSSSTEKNLILLHTFLLVVAVAGMVIAIIVDQRQRIDRALRTLTKDLLWMNERLMKLLEIEMGKTGSKPRSRPRSRGKKK